MLQPRHPSHLPLAPVYLSERAALLKMYPRSTDQRHLVPLLDFIRFVSYQGRHDSQRVPKRINGSKGLPGEAPAFYADDGPSISDSDLASVSRQVSLSVNNSYGVADGTHRLQSAGMEEESEVTEDISLRETSTAIAGSERKLEAEVSDANDDLPSLFVRYDDLFSPEVEHEGTPWDREGRFMPNPAVESNCTWSERKRRPPSTTPSENDEESAGYVLATQAESPPPVRPRDEEDAATDILLQEHSARRRSKNMELFPLARRESSRSVRKVAYQPLADPVLRYEYIQPGTRTKGSFSANYVDVPLSIFGAERLLPTWDAKLSKRAAGQSCCYLALGTSIVVTGVVLEVDKIARTVQVAPDRGLNATVEWIDFDRVYRVPEGIAELRAQVAERMRQIVKALSS